MSAKPASRVGKGLSRRERTCLWHVLDAKNRPLWDGSLCWRNLSFRAVTRKVLSAQTSLTSVFGMGTGGPSS